MLPTRPPRAPDPGDEGPVLTGVALLSRWRWREFRETVQTLRQAGHVIEIEEGKGLLERTFTVTATLSVLNRLLGDAERYGRDRRRDQ